MQIWGFDVFNNRRIEDIKPETGDVIDKAGKKIAVYKNKDGSIRMTSARCTHMGCVVRWNNKDGTWDCPCHGSRYDKNGKVIKGPAVKDLEKLEADS